jgi:hypothetical protein
MNAHASPSTCARSPDDRMLVAATAEAERSRRALTAGLVGVAEAQSARRD